MGTAVRGRGFACRSAARQEKDGCCTCGAPDCRQLGRHPRTKHGVDDATTERSLIEKRWAEWPHARIGVALGTPSRVLALIIEGAAGKESLRKLLERNEALKKTVTIADGEFRIRLFRVPAGCTVRHRELDKGLTILGDGDLMVMPSRIGLAKPGFLKGRALGEVEIAEAPKWLLDQCARQVPRVLKVDEIKIADVLIGENRRSLNPEKVAEISRLDRDDRSDESDHGAPFRGRQARSCRWSTPPPRHRIARPDAYSCRDHGGRRRRSPAVGNRRTSASRQPHRLRGGRAVGGMGAAHRRLASQFLDKKSRNPAGRRVALRRQLGDCRSKAKRETPAASGSNARSKLRPCRPRPRLPSGRLDWTTISRLCVRLPTRKGGRRRSPRLKRLQPARLERGTDVTRGTAKKKGTSTAPQATHNAPSARSDSMDIPAAADNPPTVPEIDAEDDTVAEIEKLKAELAEKTENLREAQEELRQAHLAAARAAEHAVASPPSAPSADDLEIPAMFDRRPLSVEDQAMFTALVSCMEQRARTPATGRQRVCGCLRALYRRDAARQSAG